MGAAARSSFDTFSGGITNSGAITAGVVGIEVGGNGFNGGSVKLDTFSGGITNSGAITAGYFGIEVGGDGRNGGSVELDTFSGGITNSGTISAAVGIEFNRAPGTSVFDSGVITGTGGTAIELSPSSGSDTLTLAAGYAITGNVVGGGGDTLQLGGSGAANFDLSNVGTQYTGFTTFQVTGGTWDTTGAGSNWVVEGGTLEVGGSVSDTTVDTGGALDILTGGTADPTIVEPGGSETVQSGGSDTGALVSGTQYVYGSAIEATVYAGSGRQVVENGGTISGTVISGGTVEVVSGGRVDFDHLQYCQRDLADRRSKCAG